MSEITAERLAELRALTLMGSALPWRPYELDPRHIVVDASGETVVGNCDGVEDEDDLALIVAAVNALPELLAELECVTAELERITNHAKANAASYRHEVNNIVAGYEAEIEELKAGQRAVIPVVGEVAMCPEHGCARWMCECFPATSTVEGAR